MYVANLTIPVVDMLLLARTDGHAPLYLATSVPNDQLCSPITDTDPATGSQL
jgi:hypothetical protein